MFYILSREAGETGTEPVGDAWQNHLLNLILFDDNAFSQDAAAYSLESLGESLKDAAARDLAALQLLYKIVPARHVMLFQPDGWTGCCGRSTRLGKTCCFCSTPCSRGNSAATEMKIRLHNACCLGRLPAGPGRLLPASGIRYLWEIRSFQVGKPLPQPGGHR